MPNPINLSINAVPYWAIDGVLVIAVVLFIAWSLHDRRKVKKQLQAITDFIAKGNKDIAGLCSAAIVIDQRLSEQESSLQSIQAQLNDRRPTEANNQPYQGIIQKAQNGASAEELMQLYGLSRDEAGLLIRLHGTKTKHERDSIT